VAAGSGGGDQTSSPRAVGDPVGASPTQIDLRYRVIAASRALQHVRNRWLSWQATSKLGAHLAVHNTGWHSVRKPHGVNLNDGAVGAG
jgi:hypothetical protein